MKTRSRFLAVSCLLALVVGCGSGVSAGLSTEPATPSVPVGERLEISLLSEDALRGEPEWDLQELYGGGLLSSHGRTVTYLAPQAAGSYHVVVRATRGDGSPARLVQAIRVLPIAKVDPSSSALRPAATQAFAVRIKGLPRGTVSWKVEDAESGSITPEGLYTAPSRPGTYRVIATSTEDPSLVLTAVVTVN